MKTRSIPDKLKIMRSLNIRSALTSNEKSYLENLEKGYEGEVIFDGWLEKLLDGVLIINDLLVESNHTLFQIDSLIIIHDTIYLLEIKNYEGDFIIIDDKWYTISKTEITNPLLQVQRAEHLFKRLLQNLGFNYSIKPYLIFVHSNFYLYQAPPNLPIIFPTQLERFLNSIQATRSTINSLQKKLALQLLSNHITDAKYDNIPKYSYDELTKGLSCKSCSEIIHEHQGKILVCSRCGFIEDMETAILRGIGEYKTLFPTRKITTNSIQDWCKIKSKKTTRDILSRNFNTQGSGKSYYYVDK